jgi:hypothetical protein
MVGTLCGIKFFVDWATEGGRLAGPPAARLSRQYPFCLSLQKLVAIDASLALASNKGAAM